MTSHEKSSPAGTAIAVALGSFALIVGIILLANLAVGTMNPFVGKDAPGNKPELVAKRIAPVARLAVDPNAPAAPAPAAPAAVLTAQAPAPAAAAGADGKKVYDGVCTACHGAGVAGAPKFGDKAAWKPRIAQGKDALYNSVLKGKGAMPPKGGNAALPDADVKAAVDYMVSAAK